IALWTALARAYYAYQPNAGNRRGEMQRDGLSAALNAYGISRTAVTRAESLAVAAVGLDLINLSRPALTAYEASLALVDDAAVRAAYLDLRARKGFRIVNHSVDADLATPRVCVQFSEDLVKAGVDYASFFTVDGNAPRAIEAKGRQVCVEGLEHGHHYRIGIRQGLPAAVGETIASPVSLAIYVRDRAPSVRFSTENFVLPAAGRHGIPMVSINTPTAQLKLHRVGDRGLAGMLGGYMFL